MKVLTNNIAWQKDTDNLFVYIYNVNNREYVILDGIGVEIWDMVVQGVAVEDIIKKILFEYDETEEIIKKDVFSTMTELKNSGVIS